jgi:YbbR domain-containing protein
MIGFKKWLVNNIDIKLLAFVMAIILWFYIASEYNISAEKYYRKYLSTKNCWYR